MQKLMFAYALLILSIYFLPTESVITDGNIGIRTLFRILISLSFYVFYAILVMKSRYRSWKTLSLLFLNSSFYAFLLLNRIYSLFALSDYVLPAYIALITLTTITSIVWLIRNRGALEALKNPS